MLRTKKTYQRGQCLPRHFLSRKLVALSPSAALEKVVFSLKMRPAVIVNVCGNNKGHVLTDFTKVSLTSNVSFSEWPRCTSHHCLFFFNLALSYLSVYVIIWC